jgi:hypothetical protein
MSKKATTNNNKAKKARTGYEWKKVMEGETDYIFIFFKFIYLQQFFLFSFFRRRGSSE